MMSEGLQVAQRRVKAEVRESPALKKEPEGQTEEKPKEKKKSEAVAKSVSPCDECRFTYGGPSCGSCVVNPK